ESRYSVVTLLVMLVSGASLTGALCLWKNAAARIILLCLPLNPRSGAAALRLPIGNHAVDNAFDCRRDVFGGGSWAFAAPAHEPDDDCAGRRGGVDRGGRDHAGTGIRGD